MDQHQVAALAECIAPLDDEGRCAVRRHWDRVVREEMRGAAHDRAVAA